MSIALAQTSIWVLCGTVFVLILWRPRRIPEYVWAMTGAILLVLFRLLSARSAWQAICAGTDVYLFLAGMMLLAELARQHGVFDWLAAIAMHRAQGSQIRLFTLVYGIGILVTSLLSNDATAVLLTPAVLAVVRRARTSPLPYLLACAFIANAASFVLPISNPANLVVFDAHLPPLGRWLAMFGLPSLVSVLATYVLLFWHSRANLRPPMQDGVEDSSLSQVGRRAALGVLLASGALLVTSAINGPIGPATFVASLVAMFFVARKDWRIMTSALRQISWGVLLLVAGLFVIVEALNGAGALTWTTRALRGVTQWHPAASLTAVAFGMGIASNAINNLPMGLVGSASVRVAHASTIMHGAVLLGIDLGPNLSVTGSLATILWLIALRREGIHVTRWEFLRVGILVMPPALLLAVLALAAVHP
ncbi:MAG TPA: arsenic transporter [Acidobacteriaceae bacterium]|nr:arsenic transporter [Acidobacteriaceae bacterium]